VKEYFKYSQGFVNVNDENLYLTNSGNWSEIESLREKSPESIRKNRQKRFRFDAFLFVILLITGYSIFWMSKTGSITFPIIVVALGFGVFKYFRNELGNVYKIPRDKITSIVISEEEAKINFLNADNQPDFETIDGLGPKGKTILEDLKK